MQSKKGQHKRIKLPTCWLFALHLALPGAHILGHQPK